MRQFTISLDKETQRPITFLKNWYGLDAMIDTGALFPIWVGDEDVMRLMMKIICSMLQYQMDSQM